MNGYPYVVEHRKMQGCTNGRVISSSVDAAKYGIDTLAPKFFDGALPDLVVSGPNVGSEWALSKLCLFELISSQVTSTWPYLALAPCK